MSDSKQLIAWVGARGRPPSRLGSTPVSHIPDSDAFLLSHDLKDFSAFVVLEEQSGVSAFDLLRLIRRRSSAPLLYLTRSLEGDFVRALELGADMVLDAQPPPEHIAAALAAVERRASAVAGSSTWVFRPARQVLVSPTGTEISLTGSDVVLLEAISAADDATVAREDLLKQLWNEDDERLHNALHATVYRLRRRMEQGGGIAPLQAIAGRGYTFRAPLRREA